LNQDVIFHQTSQTARGETIGLFLVCDGMGGRRGGEIASRIAVDTVSTQLAEIFASSEVLTQADQTRPSYLNLAQKVEAAIEKANQAIRQYAKEHPDKTPELGTTLTLALVYGSLAYIANIGDGRAYVWREGQIYQITQDHSLAAKLAEEGVIKQEEIAHHPRSNLILRALGAKEEIEIDMFDWTLQPGDKFLLCSDGLWKSMGDPTELAQWLGSPTTAADLCQQLVYQAKERDGSDNISAIVVSISEEQC
jgi:serine/threonine protein phosphatase PrpC